MPRKPKPEAKLLADEAAKREMQAAAAEISKTVARVREKIAHGLAETTARLAKQVSAPVDADKPLPGVVAAVRLSDAEREAIARVTVDMLIGRLLYRSSSRNGVLPPADMDEIARRVEGVWLTRESAADQPEILTVLAASLAGAAGAMIGALLTAVWFLA